MKRRHRELMHELRAAKPTAPLSGETWAKSERAERLLKGVLAEAETAGQPRRSAPWLVMPRLAWLAGALVVVGLALFLALYLVPALSGHDQTASSSTVTSTHTPMVETITTEEALGEIVSLFREIPPSSQGQAGPMPSEDMGILPSALVFGLVRGSEVSSDALGRPTTRREFVLWIWRGWGTVLPVTATVPAVADLKGLSPEERQALNALVPLDIMQLDSSGAFRGNDDLTGEEAATALARLRVLLEK